MLPSRAPQTRLRTHTHPPKRLAHPRSPIPPLSTLTSRATHAHPTSPRSTGFCAIWGCINSSSSTRPRCREPGAWGGWRGIASAILFGTFLLRCIPLLGLGGWLSLCCRQRTSVLGHLSSRSICNKQASFSTPPTSVERIGSRQQKQRLRAPRRRSSPPSWGGCRRSGRPGRPRPSASPCRSRCGAPSRG